MEDMKYSFPKQVQGRIAPFSETNLLNPKYGYSIYIISLNK
jgi:hypothetical protein